MDFTVIKPDFPIFFFIYTFGFLFYVIAAAISLFIVMKNEFKNPTDKIAWVITIIFAPIIGVILFIFLGKKQMKSKIDKHDL